MYTNVCQSNLVSSVIITVATATAKFTEFYIDSTSVRLHWAKPDIIGEFIQQAKVIGHWWKKLDLKFMQCKLTFCIIFR